MHDNPRPHIFHIVTRYLQEVGIQTLDWPARSPDLNPIEHVYPPNLEAVSSIRDLRTRHAVVIRTHNTWKI
ncbi:hypothetical protein ANN_15912 [Periplaneta americana]|uniref:Uncharacterized protein n=1 Tax=Periplaneta americana TaxID=6978 RepID=A0ABQ8SHN0_PERAM|nr:hypothetical protein ANN_15912 [Periplaneta americana]